MKLLDNAVLLCRGDVGRHLHNHLAVLDPEFDGPIVIYLLSFLGQLSYF